MTPPFIPPEQLLAVLADAQAVLTGLGSLHASGRVHGQLGPDALLRRGGQVVGIASPVANGNPDRMLSLGMLRYASPEQAGRMEGKLTPRSDLYGVGILLYEWLSGAPPFVSNDLLGLAHRQLTEVPPHLSDRIEGVPKPLSDIVGKLLAKPPGERYGSCAALAYDLAEFRRRFEAGGEVTLFPLGSRDAAGPMHIPDKLYGRETEVARLAEWHRRAASGGAVLCLVGGYSGIGKTALVSSLRPLVAAAGGVMLEGKHDQFRRQTPYSAIGRMFGTLLRRILSESTLVIEQWRRRMEVTEAADGPSALAQVRAADYDLAVLDGAMPGMDGWQLAAAIREIPGCAALPLVLATSTGLESSHLSGKNGRFQRTLIKPLRPAQLAGALAESLTGWMPDPAAPIPKASRGAGVLLVEDTKVNQMVARAMLEKGGHQVTVVGNGVEALAELEQPGLFDVILMDCQMPEMDGFEATRQLRLREQERGWPPYRVVAMTANAMQSDKDACLEAGMDDYLSKPVRMEQLLKMVTGA